MILYLELDWDSQDRKILNISTVEQGNTYVKAILESNVLDFNKLSGYDLKPITDGYEMVFNEEKYNNILKEKERQESTIVGEQMMTMLAMQAVLVSATDDQAYIMRYQYAEWMPYNEYKIGDRQLYGDNLYKCKQAHTSQNDWTPDKVPALWDLIAPEGDPTLGTKDNPIIIPEPFSSMVYVCGKYYKEGDTLYLMQREGMEDGEEISLNYKPSALIDNYFVIVE